jgi:hypothetical protein
MVCTYTPPKIMARAPTKISLLLISPCYITPKHEIKISNTGENLAKHLSILVIYLKIQYFVKNPRFLMTV